MVQPIKYCLDKCDLNSVKLNSCAVPSHHVAHDMLRVIRAQCAAHDLRSIWPSHLSVRAGDTSRHCEEIVKHLELGLSMRLSLLSSKSGLALHRVSYYGKLRTVRSGGSWL